jgi:hypothetical protein
MTLSITDFTYKWLYFLTVNKKTLINETLIYVKSIQVKSLKVLLYCHKIYLKSSAS